MISQAVPDDAEALFTISPAEYRAAAAVLVTSVVGTVVVESVVPVELEQPAHRIHTMRSIPGISKNFAAFFIYNHCPAGLIKTVSTKNRGSNAGIVIPYCDLIFLLLIISIFADSKLVLVGV